MEGVAERADRVFALQSEHKWHAKVSSLAERKVLLRRFREAVLARAADIETAVISDLPQPRSPDLPWEVTSLTYAIDQTLDEMDDWARPLQVQASPHLPGTEPTVVYEARGVCLIFGPWNVPFQLLFEPMVAAIAAGNTAILKPNALTPATAQISAEIVRAAFDEREVALFEGGIDVAETLLALPVDHIFFTGSPAVGKIVMAAAAQHLTTVTLELGGKSPAIIDGTHDIAETARQVAAGRHAHGGQEIANRKRKPRHLPRLNGMLDTAAPAFCIDRRELQRVAAWLDGEATRSFEQRAARTVYRRHLRPLYAVSSDLAVGAGQRERDRQLGRILRRSIDSVATSTCTLDEFRS